MFNRILVATDGSELSDKAVAAAIELAAQHRAHLFAFSAVQRMLRSFMEGTSSYAVTAGEEIDRERTAGARSMLEGVCERARAQGVACEIVLVHSGLVAESIIEAAESRGCDLIVMASHGRKGLGRLLLGSETLHVLTHSGLPVLVLR